MRSDLAQQGESIPVINKEDKYLTAKEVSELEFIYSCDVTGDTAVKTKEGELFILYSIDLDFIEKSKSYLTKEETKELTEEQKTIQALEKKLERAQRRAGKTAAERDENKKLVKDLKAALDAKVAEGTQPLTEAEVNRRAKEIANTELTAREFNKAQEKLIDAATAIDKNFMSKVHELAADVAPLPEFFIGALDDIDNGGAVLNYLTDNPDEYEDLLKADNPMKVMMGLVKISDKLIEAAKPKVKKVSQAPEPAKGLKGNTRSPNVLPAKPTENMAEFVRVRNMQAKQRREERGD